LLSSADLLLIDEKKGRVVAADAGLQYMGLAGALIEAKRRNIISSLKELLTRITEDAGFRLSPDVRIAVLKAAGEL
jgi:predicted nucleic acid-binding protein